MTRAGARIQCSHLNERGARCSKSTAANGFTCTRHAPGYVAPKRAPKVASAKPSRAEIEKRTCGCGLAEHGPGCVTRPGNERAVHSLACAREQFDRLCIEHVTVEHGIHALKHDAGNVIAHLGHAAMHTLAWLLGPPTVELPPLDIANVTLTLNEVAPGWTWPDEVDRDVRPAKASKPKRSRKAPRLDAKDGGEVDAKRTEPKREEDRYGHRWLGLFETMRTDSSSSLTGPQPWWCRSFAEDAQHHVEAASLEPAPGMSREMTSECVHGHLMRAGIALVAWLTDQATVQCACVVPEGFTVAVEARTDVAKPHALHSQERTDWQTPTWVLDLVRRVGPIAFDPASTALNPTRALAFCARPPGYAPDECGVWKLDGHVFEPGGAWVGPCGLVHAWPLEGLTFINPPYGAHLDGMIPNPSAEVWRKRDGVRTLLGYGTGWASRIALHEGEWIALVPNRTETRWWKVLRRACVIACLPDRRIAFVDPESGETGNQPNHGSTIFYHGPRPDRFVAAFKEIGDFITGGTSVVGEKRGGGMREVEGLRRRTIQRPMTPAARAERETFIAAYKRKVSATKTEIQKNTRFAKELIDGSFAWTSHTRVMADDDTLEIFYVNQDEIELWRRPQTIKERNLELPLNKAG